MSWEATSFFILGLVLLAGFGWYERSRPPSQVVALVAALAALAIAGRIAFAAFPNVKPTTDIVIFAGYALGGAPGFAVGALAGLVSNFWFGQGPWTPWQMAGWGLCGVLGALFALGSRGAGRLALASVCGFAGILYGALLNFSLMATYGGDLSWKHFWVLEGRAIPFEVAHVAGNVVLALAAGPAMVRMLTRFRERFEWRQGGEPAGRRGARPGLGGVLRSGGTAALILSLLLIAFAPTPARASSVSRAAAWLEAQQRPSGGFAADSGRVPGVEMTSWAMLGLAAAGRNPLDVVKGGKSPVDFLRSHLGEVEDAGDVARTILSLEASGVDPHSFGGENLIERLLSQRRQNGSYQGWPATSAYAVLALRGAAAGDTTAGTVKWLRKVQGKDGGWGNEPGDPSTPEITGAVLQVLSPGSNPGGRALSYLRDAKRPNGGFAPGNNLAANAQSTAWTAEGLLAAGKDPGTFGSGSSSYSYIRGLQADDGHFLKAPGEDVTPVWVTSNAIIPLSGHFLPISAPPREPQAQGSAPSSADTGSSAGGAPSSSLPPSGASPQSSDSARELLEKFGAAGGSGDGGTPSADSAPTGKHPPGTRRGKPSSAGAVPKGGLGNLLGGEAPDSSPAEATAEPASESAKNSSSSTAGALVLGLLAGCVLFAIGLAGRKGWMRWRYGL
ncbi:MAG: prenyltransferase/squalene oxidase repeat-containing protein [Solirubrobacterales bacterium]